MNELEQFYNQFNSGEETNIRHKYIMSWLIKFGMKPGMNILEVGCGNGNVSAMVGEYIGPKGTLTAVDLSSERIKHARKKYKHIKNVNFINADITTWNTQQKFDLIFLPDVLEHIHYAYHMELFANIYNMLDSIGFVVIHIPDPLYLNSIRRKTPEKLQPVDQSLSLAYLHHVLTTARFYITYLESYRIWEKVIEYQVIVARKEKTIRLML